MRIIEFSGYAALQKHPILPAFRRHVETAPNDNFFQSPGFMEFISTVPDYRPFLLLAVDDMEVVRGSLLGVIQSDGRGAKAWFSRRAIIWGGPLLAADQADQQQQQTVRALLQALKGFTRDKAIFIEFRNFFDTAEWKDSFGKEGYTYHPHLNFLVRLDSEDEVLKRMSSNRRRQIKASIKAGAVVSEPESELEVRDFYNQLRHLYRTKVRKPLPGFELFLNFWKSPHGKIFLVKRDNRILGGAAGPVYRNRQIYQWYVFGDNHAEKGVHSSVLATWAQLDYGLKNGFLIYDFMGAGRPDEPYGVREFKARFGGEEVCYGRYELILNKTLYQTGKWGLKIYKALSGFA